MFRNTIKHTALLLTLAALLPQPSLCQTESGYRYPRSLDYPKVQLTGKTVESFIPKGWTTLDRATGDLNGDKQDDVAIVLKAEKPEFKQKNTEGLGVDTFDTNPRMLLVLFKDAQSNRYRLVEQSNSFIATADSPTMLDPFESMAIRNGALEVNFMLLFSAGGWSASKTCYKFRYQQDQFVLIGADKNEIQRNTGEETNFSINFLTGRMKVSNLVPMEEFKSAESWSKFSRGKLRSLNSFKTLYDWQPQPGLFL